MGIDTLKNFFQLMFGVIFTVQYGGIGQYHYIFKHHLHHLHFSIQNSGVKLLVCLQLLFYDVQVP